MIIPFSLLFLGLSSLLGCLGALAFGSLTPFVSAGALVAAGFVALFLSRHFKLSLKAAPVSVPVFILYALIFVGIYFHSVFLFYQKSGSYWIQNPFNLGDMSFHWGTIRFLGKGAEFWPENPIYMGYRFKYPFGMDLFNAFFENLGVSIQSHLPLVTLLALILTFYVLHIAGGPLLVFAIFFSGGLYNFTMPGSWDVARVQDVLDFKNLFLTVLLTQRGFLYALPAGVFLYSALQKSFSGNWQPKQIEKISLGIIWGALGFFHLHSFFFVSLYLGLLILWNKELKKWLWTLGIAAVLGLPFVVNALIPEVGTNSLIHFNLRGWARPEEMGVFEYWSKNLGFWILAMGVCLGVFFRQKKWNSLVPTALAFILFLIFAHLILAPWNWDNIKLIIWSYTFGIMAMSDLLWNQRSENFKGAVFLCFLPGLMLFIHSLPIYTHGIQWASEREINKAEVLLKNHSVNQGLVIVPTYEHPALLLGYKLYMGYPGHVWSHGYNYGSREVAVNRIYDGTEGLLDFAEKPLLIYSGSLEKGRVKPLFPSKELTKIGEALDHELYLLERK